MSALRPGAYTPRMSPGRVCLLALCAVALTTVQPAHSTLYSCTESPGVTVITDSPAQLSGCSPLGDARSSAPETPSDRPGPAPETVTRMPVDGDRSPLVPQIVEQSVRPSALSVPLERIGSLFVVTIQINETRSAKLILDTGASHTILSHKIAQDLGLFSLRPAASVTMHTVSGSVQADLVQIDSIRIAGAEVRNTLAAIHDLPEAPPEIEGLLGLNVLGHFDVTLDTVRNRLHLGVPHP